MNSASALFRKNPVETKEQTPVTCPCHANSTDECVSDIPRRDSHELQCILNTFHANQTLQAECHEILCNEAKYLVPEHNKEQGSCLVAKIDIPAGKHLTLYALVSSMVALARTTCTWVTLD